MYIPDTDYLLISTSKLILDVISAMCAFKYLAQQ